MFALKWLIKRFTKADTNFNPLTDVANESALCNGDLITYTLRDVMKSELFYMIFIST